MKNKNLIYCLVAIMLLFISFPALAGKKKVGQSGMSYLAISMGARESAMGDAATALTNGIQGIWHNPSVLADIKRFGISINQVNWMVETKLYGVALAYSLGNWGTIGVDLTYMDYGEIMGTQRVDKSIDYRGFILTGDLGVEDYSIGLAYARRINDKFALGFKIKSLHESLGSARYVWKRENEGLPEQTDYYNQKVWSLDDWGLDFGTVYDIGWKDLKVAMIMQNFSRDMKYWYEEFTTPMALRIGLAMDLCEVIMPNNEAFDFNFAVDAIHPNDYTERIHLGGEIVYLDRFAFRGGYKFNHDVENFTFGIGVNFSMAGLTATVDYAFTSANYFQDINRFSIHFNF